MKSIATWRTALSLATTFVIIGCDRSPTSWNRVAGPSFSKIVPGSGSWTVKAPMPGVRTRLGVAALQGKLYAIGGTVSGAQQLGTVEAYDPARDTWTTKAPMPTGRFGLGVAALQGKLYAIGGFGVIGGGFGILSTVEAYDPATDTWTTKAPMPTGRNELAVAALNGIIYAIGGIGVTGGGFSQLGTVEAYDPATDTWTTKAPMPTGRNGLGVATLHGKLYAVGGTNAVEAYDPATDTWTTKAPMSTRRILLGVAALGGILYAVGGADVSAMPTVEAYDPGTDTWSTVAPMSTPRWGLVVAALYGKLYAVGGDDDNLAENPVLATVEAFRLHGGP